MEKLSKKSSAKPKKKGQGTTAVTSSTLAASSATTSSSPAKLTLSPAKPKKEAKVEKKQAAGDGDLFHQFCELCHSIEKEPSYNAKTKIVANYIKCGGEQEFTPTCI